MPSALLEGDTEMQGKRTRARDSRGRPVPGLYVRDGRFIAGYTVGGRWTMQTLEAETLTDARRERESLITGFRDGRIAIPATATFAAVFAEYQASRNLSARTLAHEQHLLERHLSAFKTRRVQEINASEIAERLRELRESY